MDRDITGLLQLINKATTYLSEEELADCLTGIPIEDTVMLVKELAEDSAEKDQFIESYGTKESEEANSQEGSEDDKGEEIR